MKSNHHRITRTAGACLAALLLGTSLTPCRGGQPPSPPTPVPERNPLSFLDGRITFDLQERLRGEVRENNFDFNDASEALTDDSWLLQRFRIGVLIKPTSWLKVYGQGQDSQEFDSDRPDIPGNLGAEGDDDFDLRQAYLEFGNTKAFPLTFKVGRQILSYGDERLIGGFEWNNIGRTFDAAKLRWEDKLWSLDAFAATVAVPDLNSYNQSDLGNGNETDRGQVFSGLYFGTTVLSFQTTEAYVLHLHEETGARYQPAARGDTNFATLGLRVKSKPGVFASQATPPATDGKQLSDGKSTPPPAPKPKPVGFDYDAELAFQTGEVRGLDLASFAAHVAAGYTFDVAWLPRLALGYSYGSGDDNPLDGEIETFQNLFPTNHKFYGQADFFSWQNMHDLEINLKANPIRAVTLKADFHAFFLASNDDVWYRANGVTAVRPLNAAARNADTSCGREIDLLVSWAVNKNLSVEAGYSHFFAGEYLDDTGASDDADFGYLQSTVTF